MNKLHGGSRTLVRPLFEAWPDDDALVTGRTLAFEGKGKSVLNQMATIFILDFTDMLFNS